ncbi:hypothetical protein INR49_016332 [Caranx melampygus]|nr:hypothetical protein INR49_016332 [Caranx melampygus]
MKTASVTLKGNTKDWMFLFLFNVEDDFPLVRVVVVLIADLVGDDSALDLGIFLSDQTEPNSHQRRRHDEALS